MAGPQVIIEMGVRDAEQVRAWLRAKQGIKETGEELERVAAKGKRAGGAVESGFAGVLPVIGKVSGALVGVGTAIAGISKVAELIKRQYEEMLAKKVEAAGAQMGVSGSLRAAVSSFIGRPDAPSVGAFHSRMVSGANGVDLNDLYQSFTGAMGSAGNVPVANVQGAVLESARQRPDLNREDRENLVRATVMLAKEFKEPLDQTMAAVIQASMQDATATLGDFAKNVVPTVIQARAFGGHKDSFRSIMADVQGVGLVAGDPHGRRTSTAYLNALQTIKEETLKAGLVGQGASIEEQLAAARGNKKIQEMALGVFATSDGLDPAKALSAFRRNKLSKGELGGEARTFMAGVEFLQSNQDPKTNPFARERANAFKTNLGMTPEAVKAVEELNKQFSASPIGQTEALGRAKEQFKNATLFKQFDAAQEGSMLELTNEIRYRQGMPTLQRGAEYVLDAMRGTGSKSVGDEPTPQRRLEYARTVAERAIGSARGPRGTSEPDAALVDSLKELISRLDTQIELLNDQSPKKVEVTGRTNQPAAPAAGRLNDQ